MKCGTERENRHVTRHDRARTQNTNREEEKKKKGWVDSLFFFFSFLLDGQRKNRIETKKKRELSEGG